MYNKLCLFLLNFYPRSPCGERRLHCVGFTQRGRISIHALLAESDNAAVALVKFCSNFYPRSPCGERLCNMHSLRYRCTNFYPRSPCGERPCARQHRGAVRQISIHALLAESDCIIMYPAFRRESNFYPRSPCGERRFHPGYRPR